MKRERGFTLGELIASVLGCVLVGLGLWILVGFGRWIWSLGG